MQSTWFNVRLKAHCMAVLTHLQRMSYDTSSWFYTSASTRCFLYLMSLYIGSKPPEISEHMNFMKIFYVPFFVDILLLVCRAVPLFLLTHRCRSGGPCRYLEHVRQKLRKFSRDLWKKRFQLKKWNFVKIFQPHFELHFFLIFWAESFFQKLSENILCTLRMCSRYLQGFCDIVLCFSKKIVAARHTNQIICQEKWKQLRFWKNEAQNAVGIFWQNFIFWVETFFQRSLEMFL